MKLLKVFDKGLKSPYQNMVYKLHRKYTCEDFDEDPTIDCSRGFYATDWDGLPYAYRPGKNIYEAEVSGKSVEFNQFKRRYEHIEIIKKLSLKDIKEGLRIATLKSNYDLYHSCFPFNPLLKIKKVTQKEIDLLKQWDSVRDSVRASVRDSVGAYISSLFPNINKWKYINHSTGVNPFQPCIDLWNSGFVSSFDGKIWRLHTGKKAKIVYEWNKNESN